MNISVNNKITIVCNLSQLSMLLKQKNCYEWKFEIAELTQDENIIFENKIKKYHGACGCPLGAMAMLIGISSYLTLLYLSDFHKTDQIFLEILFGFIIIVVSVGLGKTLGIFIARCKLKNCLYKLQRKIYTHRPEIIF